ncbi:MAG: oligosaccharide flippase family protein [Chitinophagaceae bacterium]
MISFVKTLKQSFFKVGHERSMKVRKNVTISFLIKGASIPISLLLIPMTINYINPVQYGIWLTVSSIIGWMNFFDIGLGNGLKNKLAHSYALNQPEEMNKYVSTTYAVMSIIAAVFFVGFYSASFFFDWNKILNIPPSLTFNVRPVIIVVLFCFSIQFVILILNTLLTATHQPSKSSVITFIGQLATLVIIFLLTRYVPANLTILVIVLAGTPILVMFFSGLYLFKTDLKALSPKFSNVDFRFAKSLLNTGGIFFFIQLGALILFQTDNIIITRILGPQSVTTFNVSYKLFSILVMAFNIIVTPFWSAFTDAYAKKDFDWIKSSIKRMRQLWMVLSVVALILFFISHWVYKLWIGDAVIIPVSLSLAMAFYVIAYMWQTLHVYLLNGVGKVRLQLYLVLCSSLVNIPLAVFLGRKFGLVGIISASTFLFIIMGIIFSIQCERIINQKANGIWGK